MKKYYEEADKEREQLRAMDAIALWKETLLLWGMIRNEKMSASARKATRRMMSVLREYQDRALRLKHGIDSK